MQTFKLKKRYTMENSDICSVGVMLGYQWNEVCGYISDVGLYGQDGSGYYTVERDEPFDHEQMDAIFNKIFEDNPEVDEIYVLD